ncbi:hypothetical protein Rumeso_00864 [Rubellimicrobium mesophilum DSM 19309]|uniref:Uncharacterized protein n=1 Tax=Rubellimicrobium mesophilum DSM 19309 TaxID=442562 RepID=A0A017HU73_9RHOB|nr:hypothetical protein [Rubellimicrobium mesophilum]EYD77698.1 hypothetical protein Rumeso_00864 [Rubellimicrobium mesophilum DSM 19309]
MTDRPTTPPRTKGRNVVNADVPSETAMKGLPDIGTGASAAHFARDAVSLNAGEGHEDSDGVTDAEDVKD